MGVSIVEVGSGPWTSMMIILGTSPSDRFNDEEVCTCPEASITQQFSSIPWNSFNREVLSSLYDFAPISMHCNKSTAVRFPVSIAGSAFWESISDGLNRSLSLACFRDQRETWCGLSLGRQHPSFPKNSCHSSQTRGKPALHLGPGCIRKQWSY